MVALSSLGGAAAQFLDNNGVILSGGKIYTYAAGTTTPQATYTSSSGATPHTNPIVLDSAGRVPGGEIWLTNGVTYKFVIETSLGVLLGTYDNLSGINDLVLNANNVEYDPPFTGALTSGYTVQDRLAQTVSVMDFGAVGDGVTDDTTALNDAADAARAGSKALFLPAVSSFYLVSDTIDFSDLLVVDGKGAEIRGAFGAIPAVILGGINVVNGYFWVEVRNSADKSTTAGNQGIQLKAMSDCKLWLYVRGFNDGLYFDGAAASTPWVGNEFNILRLYNNGSHVHFDLALDSYAVANQFIGGGYYLGTNQKVDGRGTFKLTLGGAAQVSSNVVMNAEVGIDGGSAHANHGGLVYTTLNTSSNVSTLFFQNTRLEAYGSWADPMNIVKIPTVTSGQINITGDFLSYSFASQNFLVSIPEEKNIDVDLRYIGGSSGGSPRLPVRITPSYCLPYQANNELWAPGRIIYDTATGYNVPVEAITTGVGSRVNRALGDGYVVMSSTENSIGLIYNKGTNQPAFIKIPDENQSLAIVCFDASGNVLGGTSPYYVQGRFFRSITRGSVAIYEMRSNWIWLHKDVASFYIGHAAWSGPITFTPNIQFDAVMGAQITVATPLGITDPNFIVSAVGGSYFRRGFMVTGRFSENGFRTTFLLNTTTNGAALSGATSITLTSTTGVLENDYIGIELDTVILGTERQWFHTRVTSIVGTTLGLASALPANVASGRSIKINRWVSLEAQNLAATAADIASATSSVNTNLKWEGMLVWDTTNNRMLRASGRGATSAWYIVDGSGSVTPV